MKIEEYQNFRAKLLQWAAAFEYCFCLEDALKKTLRVGVRTQKKFAKIEKLPQNEHLFGYISYDYKNKLEDLVSEHPETISFKDSFFFQPEIIVTLTGTEFQVEKGAISTEILYSEIQDLNKEGTGIHKCHVSPKLSKKEYVEKVEALQKHIRQGDIYEVNFCQEFVAEDVALNPLEVYNNLLKASPMPFAVFLKEENTYAFCSSPERYVKKIGNRIISQPIKGTAKRGKTPQEDAEIIKSLQNNPKERAENVMAVDVVRNDFSRIAERGTVKVDELCEVYAFEQLHQMISTVSAVLPKNCSFFEVVKATFPMASMTGAPKIRAMQLIEKYETGKRGLYSGTIGYLLPNSDFDFNVVIRTILYNSDSRKLSFTVGSAITAEANAAQEYEECLLKAQTMVKILATK